MKTFRQWYDELPEDAQRYIRTFRWVDISQPSGRKYINTVRTEETEALLQTKMIKCNDGTFIKSAIVYPTFVRAAKEEFTDDELLTIYAKLADNDIYFINYVSPELQPKVLNRMYQMKGDNPRYVQEIIECIEDFDNMPQVDVRHIYLGNVVNSGQCSFKILEIIFGSHVLKEYLKTNPLSYGWRVYASSGVHNKIFDELFFGENGWSQSSKMKFIRNYEVDLQAFYDFMKRIVAVDEKYIKAVFLFAQKRASFMTELYQKHKDNEDLTGNETKDGLYRFLKKHRKLFKIAQCCVRKSIEGQNLKILKEEAGLIRLYNFDFDRIFDSLYPEFEHLDLNYY